MVIARGSRVCGWHDSPGMARVWARILLSAIFPLAEYYDRCGGLFFLIETKEMAQRNEFL